MRVLTTAAMALALAASAAAAGADPQNNNQTPDKTSHAGSQGGHSGGQSGQGQHGGGSGGAGSQGSGHGGAPGVQVSPRSQTLTTQGGASSGAQGSHSFSSQSITSSQNHFNGSGQGRGNGQGGGAGAQNYRGYGRGPGGYVGPIGSQGGGSQGRQSQGQGGPVRGGASVNAFGGGPRGGQLRGRDQGRAWYRPGLVPQQFSAQQRFHAGWYSRPNGWYARRWSFGDFLPWGWFAPDYYLDSEDYGLPYPPIGCEWVREGSDAVLVNVWTGQVLSVAYGVFW